jgi:UDP-N-acetylglucosamine--N-acetylmuramyl-(pentapeptide) pyrophosphoryl-undecaprenol N-acetylglucosamine transferase
LYPFYATAKIVVGRAGASTLAEIAYFGLPCVVIPLPWATENHQWINAGVAETQGWGVRIKQDESTGANVERTVADILTDKETYETMARKALDHSPSAAAAVIVRTIMSGMSE